MKIAIDIREAIKKKKAGKGWYTHEIVRALLEQNQTDYFILYTDEPIEDAEWKQFRNAEIRFIQGKSFFWHWKAARDICTEKPDIFFAPTSFIIPALLPKKQRTVIVVHDLAAWILPKSNNRKAKIIEKLTLRKALKKAWKVVAVSQNTKKDIMKIFGIREDKITVIPCAAAENINLLTPNSSLHPTSYILHPHAFLLAVGTLEPRKNYKTLIRAFEKAEIDADLVIIGAKGWKYEEIFAAARTTTCANRIHFKEYVSAEELVGYYNTAQMFIFPSLYEGFGIPLVEAMKSGCPIITSNISSMPEVVGEAGLLMDPQDENDLAEKIKMLANNEPLRKELIEKGLQQAKKFSWKTSAKKLKELFHSS